MTSYKVLYTVWMGSDNSQSMLTALYPTVSRLQYWWCGNVMEWWKVIKGHGFMNDGTILNTYEVYKWWSDWWTLNMRDVEDWLQGKGRGRTAVELQCKPCTAAMRHDIALNWEQCNGTMAVNQKVDVSHSLFNLSRRQQLNSTIIDFQFHYGP